MKKTWFLYGLSFIGAIVLFFITLTFIISLFFLFYEKKETLEPKIAVLEIKGIITDSKEYLLCIKEIIKRKDIKGVVVRIDSPGGVVGPSQEIYYELKKLRKIKPVVVSMGSIATSGSYYIALGGNTIYALPGTLTGSIGVILEIPNIKKLLDKIGIETQVIKSGKFKDTGAIYKTLSEEEKNYLNQKILNIYNQFITAVSKERNLSIEKVKNLADGRIFTGEEALKLGLIDKIGTFWDAIEEAKEMAHLKKAKIVFFPKSKSLIEKLIEDNKESLLKILPFYPLYFLPNY